MRFRTGSIVCTAHDCTAQRTASVAPLATSINRHKRGHATTFLNRAQPTGRASGVNCTQCWAAGYGRYGIQKSDKFRSLCYYLHTLDIIGIKQRHINAQGAAASGRGIELSSVMVYGRSGLISIISFDNFPILNTPDDLRIISTGFKEFPIGTKL